MARKSSKLDLAEQLRNGFHRSGLSRFALAKRAGVSYSVVHRIMAGNRDITLATASKLCGVLGLEFKPVRRRPRK